MPVVVPEEEQEGKERKVAVELRQLTPREPEIPVPRRHPLSSPAS